MSGHTDLLQHMRSPPVVHLGDVFCHSVPSVSASKLGCTIVLGSRADLPIEHAPVYWAWVFLFQAHVYLLRLCMPYSTQSTSEKFPGLACITCSGLSRAGAVDLCARSTKKTAAGSASNGSACRLHSCMHDLQRGQMQLSALPIRLM